MGIRVFCPNGHRLNLKSFLAGKKGICPHCGMTVHIPSLEQAEERGMIKERKALLRESVGVGDGRRGSDVLTLEPDTDSDDACEPRLNPVAHGRNGTSRNHGSNGADRDVAVDDGGLDLAAASPSSSGIDAVRRESAPVEHAKPAPALETPEVDPIAENPAAVWYVRTPQGGQYGPAAGDIMRKWIAEGRVQPDFWVWREGWTDWKKAAGSVPGLRAAAAPGAAATAPTTPAQPANGHAPAAAAAPTRTSEPARFGSSDGSGDGYAASPRAVARPRKKGGIHPLAIVGVVGLGLVCLALLGVLIALVAGAL